MKLQPSHDEIVHASWTNFQNPLEPRLGRGNGEKDPISSFVPQACSLPGSPVFAAVCRCRRPHPTPGHPIQTSWPFVLLGGVSESNLLARMAALITARVSVVFPHPQTTVETHLALHDQQSVSEDGGPVSGGQRSTSRAPVHPPGQDYAPQSHSEDPD